MVRFFLLILPFRFVPGAEIHFPTVISLWQSNGKVEKLNCIFWQLDALRGLLVLVSFDSIYNISVPE